MGQEYEAQLRASRREREEYFAENPHSPIPPDQQDEFPGLAYFPIDEQYRFELELQAHDEVGTHVVETSTGGEREYLRWGAFEFELDKTQLSLQAYKAEPGDERLWVPFRDETNGAETYGAGRYLDLDAEAHQTTAGQWIVDFNAAYNPSCAYNEAYECPLIPQENWLDVRIEAGEKDYPGDPVDQAAYHHG